MMKSIIYLFLCAFLPTMGIAQSNYTLTGTTHDAEGKPVPFATVSLWVTGQPNPYKATAANENGLYSIDGIAQGTYRLKSELMGYTVQEIQLVFDARTLPSTVQNFTLQTDATQLKEVVIEAKKEFIEVTPDAVIIRPDANPTTQGGTATDVLQQVPSVQIDANGNITMRGGRPNVMVNGRSSGFGDMRRGGGGGSPLDQINAEDIESISVSNNPSARFDAEGGGGMIDIRLKRDRNLGTHGSIGGGIGTPKLRIMSNFRVNHRAKKWNVFTGYGARVNNQLGTGKTERTTFNPIGRNVLQFLEQNQSTENKGYNHNIRGGADYYFSDKTTIGIEGTYGYRSGNVDDNLNSDFMNASNALTNMTQQHNYTTNTSKTLEYNAVFRHEFKKLKQELTASFSQVFASDNTNNELKINYLQPDYAISRVTQRQTSNGNKNNSTIFQIDYSTPHGKKGVFETGAKITMRDLNTNAIVDSLNANIWVKDPRISNTFAFSENVQASYLAYRNSLGKWDYSTGLRLENVIMNGSVVSVENTNFRKEFLNLFPTARISYNINQDQYIKLSFSRRISRPNFGDLNPFVDISNPLNYRSGNPNINPEYNNNFEIGYTRTWDKFMFSPAVFYRLRTNIVQRITTLDTQTGITTSMPENIGTGNTYGVELTGSAKFTNWWDLNVNYSFFQNDIIASQAGRGINSSVNSWTTRINNNFTFWNNTRLTMNLFYNSPTAVAQGTILPVFGMGMGVQKPVWNKKGSIGVNVRDIFYTMRFGSETNAANFIQTSSIRRATRVVMVNFRYRF